jgi:hypothetical protein
MRKHNPSIRLVLAVIATLACNFIIPPAATQTAAPSPLAPTSLPLSSQLTLTSVPFEESSQSPVYTIRAQTPVLTGSDDPRVLAFNQVLSDLVVTQVNDYRRNFLELRVTPLSNGSFLEATHKLIFQGADIWSFKFDFSFYSDGAAHPGLNSLTMNYDLGQGRQLALSDLFLPDSNYLERMSIYCINDINRHSPGFGDSFLQGANPLPDNYRNWNITAGDLMITFDEYQVAPYAAGPQTVMIPYAELKDVIDPAGPLGQFLH